MLIELNAATRRRLLQNEDGYKLGREFTPIDDTPKHANISAPRLWPDDPPSKKNHLVLVPYNRQNSEQIFVTSTRVITIGRELLGGPMGNAYGIVCAENGGSKKTRYALGGGKTNPDFDTGNKDRLRDGEDRELVRGAAIAENREELGVQFSPSDKDAYKHYFLFGVRGITEDPDPTNGSAERVLKRIEGLSVGDACFLAITHERLGYFGGQPGETGPRHVKRASELLRGATREERMANVLPMLPYAQATALAMAIITAKEIFGNDMPPALQEVVADGEEAALRIARNSPYARNFTRVFQEGAWEV